MITTAASNVVWLQRARTFAFCLLALVVAASIGLLVGANPAHAATFTVNSKEDAFDHSSTDGECSVDPFRPDLESKCTLRAAIQEANVNGVSDTITFDPFLSGTITLTLGVLGIANDTPTKDLIIEGPGANNITVSGRNASMVFSIRTDAGATINGLTVSNGRNTGIGGGILNRGALELANSTVSENTTLIGGGIYNDSGTLTLTNSTVSENTATPSCSLGGGCSGGAAGGIANYNGTTALFDSTVSGNTARGGVGGGGLANQDGELQLTNSTVSGNTAATVGGGILNYVDKDVTTLELTNSTVSGNTATGGSGGGIFSFGEGTLTLSSSIVARNSANGDPDAKGTFTSQGYNLIGDTTGATGFVASDLKNVNPLLGPLQDNGGPTLTHALLQVSPALNVIPNATNGCGTEITTDQRGVSRPQEGKCEIGSVEPQDSIPPNTTITSGPSGTTKATSASFGFSSSEAGSKFQCKLDGSAFSACTSPKSYTGLSNGRHTFSVRAIDGAGNVDSTPATRAWTVDTTAPKVNRVVPEESATGIAPGTNVTAFFSEAMRAGSINTNTAKLFKTGATTPLAAAVSYDAEKKKATLNPDTNLQRGAKYKAVVTTGAKDLAGNRLDQDPSVAGNQQKVWFFKVKD